MNVATWTINRLALVAACIGLIALTPTQWAEAADSNPSSNGTAQVRRSRTVKSIVYVSPKARTVWHLSPRVRQSIAGVAACSS